MEEGEPAALWGCLWLLAYLWEGVHGPVARLHADALEPPEALGQLEGTAAERGQDGVLLL